MSKEVYIDGCNVAECEFFIEEYIEDFPDDNGVRIERFCAIEQKQCHDKINCYFKQLQRAKAENERLKSELEWLKTANRKYLLDKDFFISELRDLRIEYAKLYQENEKLKKEVETWSYQTEKRAEIGEVWYDTAQKYKQALEKIKEICTSAPAIDSEFSLRVMEVIKDAENE